MAYDKCVRPVCSCEESIRLLIEKERKGASYSGSNPEGSQKDIVINLVGIKTNSALTLSFLNSIPDTHL